MLNEIAILWGSNGNPKLIAERENAVYQIEIDGALAALRLHRAGYQNQRAILSELKWTARLADAGFSCPRPISQLNGDWISPLPDGRFATVISWVNGKQIGTAGEFFSGSVAEHCDLYHRLGHLLAQLHNTTDNIKTDDLTRPAWDLNGLLGKSPFWGKFWENPALSSSEKKFLIYTRDAAFEYLSGIKEPDFGLIHADALQENVFFHDDALILIDFDDAGFGYRGYDLGVPMSQHYALRYLNDLIVAIQDGYGSIRKAPSHEEIKFFLLLRCLASAGWVSERQTKKNPAQRIYAERALYLAHQWLT